MTNDDIFIEQIIDDLNRIGFLVDGLCPNRQIKHGLVRGEGSLGQGVFQEKHFRGNRSGLLCQNHAWPHFQNVFIAFVIGENQLFTRYFSHTLEESRFDLIKGHGKAYFHGFHKSPVNALLLYITLFIKTRVSF